MKREVKKEYHSDELLTIDQLRVVMGVGYKTVLNLIESGALKAVLIPGVVRKGALERLPGDAEAVHCSE